VPPELGEYEPVDPEHQDKLGRFLSAVFYQRTPRPVRPTDTEIETDLNQMFAEDRARRAATENPKDGGELIW
jgi:hypothetical protein